MLYSYLDQLLVARIAAGDRTFSTLHSGQVLEEAKRLGAVTESPDFRVTDRRLQAMRKAGKIQYCRSAGWSIKE